MLEINSYFKYLLKEHVSKIDKSNVPITMYVNNSETKSLSKKTIDIHLNYWRQGNRNY